MANRLTFEFVRDYFHKHGCTLLEDNYINARTKLRYICSCGNRAQIVFDSFRSGNRCRCCGVKKTARKQVLSPQEVSDYFESQGCELLDAYSRSCISMRYKCSCGEISRSNWNNFKRGRRCKKCGIVKRSGERHYEWQEDREQIALDRKFRQRCYKLLRMVLSVTGRVKNKRTAEMLGYDYRQLQDHIFSHPNWNNVNNSVWHIDHIFPIKAFRDYGITDLKLINCLENLRPIAAHENYSKNCKYDKSEFEDWLISKGVEYE